MTSLAESNPYLRDPERRRQILTKNAWQSSVFEGARGLPRPEQLFRKRRQRIPRTMASAKNAVSGA